LAAGAPAAAPAVAQSQEQGSSLRVAARHHLMAGRVVPVRGALGSGEAGRAVLVQVKAGRGWRTVDRTRTGDGGRFRGGWRTRAPGRYLLRARVLGGGGAAPASKSVRGRVHVYVPRAASWYGPGFYGRRTGCGRTLRAGALGVAHKTLPCGTRVTLRYRGRSVTVPVIDRGPYAGGRTYDLTAATKRKLRFGSTGVVLATR
jgi:rare lipoprotein A